MDPDQCLKELQELNKKVKAKIDSYGCWTDLAEGASAEEVDELIADTDDLCNHVDALDKWMSSGGFTPKKWRFLKDAQS